MTHHCHLPKLRAALTWLTARALLIGSVVVILGCAQTAPAPEVGPAVAVPLSPPPAVPEQAQHAPAPQARALGTLGDSPFFPIGIFSVPPGDVGRAAGLGFNLVQTYRAEGSKKSASSAASIDWLQDYLRVAEAAGAGVMLGLPRHAIAEHNDDEIRRRVQRLRGYAAVKAWYLFDEPELQDVPAPTIDRAARIVDEIDGTRPTVLVLARPPRQTAARGYFDVTDVVMVDPYPYTRAGADISSVYRTVAEAALLAAGQRQVWATIQAHGRGKGGPGFGLLEPPYRELRNMTFQAIAAGASGLFFFCYKCSQFDLTRTTLGLNNVRRVVDEIRGLAPLLASPAPAQAPLRVTAAPGIVHRTFLHDGLAWLLVVNTSRTELGFSAERQNVAALVGAPGVPNALNSGEARLGGFLEPLEVRLYQIPLP